MARTDNTRPWEIQQHDEREMGYIAHGCTRRRGPSKKSRRDHRGGGSHTVTVSWLAWILWGDSAKARLKIRSVVIDKERVSFSAWRRRSLTKPKLFAQLRDIFGEEAIEVPFVKHDFGGGASVRLECTEKWCGRTLWHYGGENYLGGAKSYERQFRRQRIRQKERAELQRLKKLCRIRRPNRRHYDDFDILPIREDNRTIYFDLT